MGTGTGPIQANLNGRIFWDQARGKLVIKDENGTQRLLASAEAVKLSQSGFNVETATDEELIFSSEFNLFKIVDSGTTSVTVPVGHTAGNIYTTNVAHSLGYAPTVIAFSNRPNATGAYNLLPYWVSSYNSGTARWEQLYGIALSSSSVDLTFAVSTNNISAIEGNWEIRYYIVQETAQ